MHDRRLLFVPTHIGTKFCPFVAPAPSPLPSCPTWQPPPRAAPSPWRGGPRPRRWPTGAARPTRTRRRTRRVGVGATAAGASAGRRRTTSGADARRRVGGRRRRRRRRSSSSWRGSESELNYGNILSTGRSLWSSASIGTVTPALLMLMVAEFCPYAHRVKILSLRFVPQGHNCPY